jgi:AmmeMemoRadiSam system protein B
MTLVGCFAMPHPPIVIPEVGGAEVAHVDATLKSMRELGKKAARLDPETIVLLSPHSPLASHRMGVSLAASFRGSLAYFHAPQVRLQVPGDQELAHDLMEEAAAHGIPVAATASRGEIVDLDHGVMVPLHFLASGLEREFKLVSLSFSYLDLEEHTRFGEAIGRVLMASPTRTLYVASSDLSHRLLRGGPNGFDPRGAEFDQAVADTFAAGDWEALLTIEPRTVEAAGECGYRSLAVLSGVVQAVEQAGIRTKNRLLSYEGPFGVGYLVGEVEMAPTGPQPAAGRRTEVSP